MTGPEHDSLLAALGALGSLEPSGNRSRAVVADAMRTIARRRRMAERRVVVMATMYAGIAAPFAAGSLSAAYLAVVILQAVVVLRHGAALLL